MRLFLLSFLVLLATPAVLAQKSAGKPEARALASSPFVGSWDYVVRPNDPVAQGTFTIVEEADGLGGTFMTDGPRQIDDVEVTGDAISFTFKQPGMGVIAIQGTLSGDTYEGEAQPEGQDALPFVATRQTGVDANDD